jgi:hypothetical protein
MMKLDRIAILPTTALALAAATVPTAASGGEAARPLSIGRQDPGPASATAAAVLPSRLAG